MKDTVFLQHKWWILLLMLLCGTGGVVCWKSCERPLPASECSEAYRRYAGREGLDASFLKDYPVNDSVAVDVTLIRATDSASWYNLLGDFHVSQELLDLRETIHFVQFRIPYVSLRGDFPETKPTNADSADFEPMVVVARFDRHEICIFQANNQLEYHGVTDRIYNDMIKNNKQSNTSGVN